MIRPLFSMGPGRTIRPRWAIVRPDHPIVTLPANLANNNFDAGFVPDRSLRFIGNGGTQGAPRSWTFGTARRFVVPYRSRQSHLRAPNRKRYQNHRFASVPLVLTFVRMRAAK